MALARDPEAEVRRTAFDNDNIRDEWLLWQLASVGNHDTRLAAAELLAELTSIDALAKDELEPIRRVVAESTSDRSLLANLAIDDGRQVRLAAMDRLDSPDLLRHLAVDKDRPEVAIDAFDRLFRLIPAAELATDDDPDIRAYYAEKSTDETMLRHLSNDPRPKVSGRARIRLFLEAAAANPLDVALHDHLDDRARAWLAEHGGFGDDHQPVIQALARDRSASIRRAARRRYADTKERVSQMETDELVGSSVLGAVGGAVVGLSIGIAWDSVTWGFAVLLAVLLAVVVRASYLGRQHGSSGLGAASRDVQLVMARVLMTFLRPAIGERRPSPEGAVSPPPTRRRLTNDYDQC